jgi:HEAT repeat protein
MAPGSEHDLNEAGQASGNCPAVEELPAYRERLHHQDEAVRRAACIELATIGQLFAGDLLLEALADPSPHVRQIAADGLIELADAGTRSEVTIEKLAGMLRLEDATARNQAMDVLARLGPCVLPVIEALLSDRDGDVRIFATYVLGAIRDPAAFDPLRAALDDPNENVRYAAAEALGHLGDPRAVEPLLEVLRADEWARFPAIEALGHLGDPRAVAPLAALLEDPWLRLPTVEALGKLGDEAIGRTLLDYVSDENPMVSHAALAALGQIDERHGTRFLATLDRSAVTALLSATLGPSCRALGLSCRALGRADQGPSALTAADAAARKSAVAALGWVGSGEMLPALLPCLGDDAEEVQAAAMQAIVRLGSRDLAALLRVFNDATVDYRPQLASALGEIARTLARSADAVDALLRGLRDPAGPVRAASAKALVETGDPRAVEPLVESLGDPDPTVRRAAAGALGTLRRVTPQAAAVTRPLLRLLQDPVWEVRSEAARAAARLGTRQVVTQLAPMVRDARPQVREAAIQALGLVEDRSADAHLVEALNSPDPAVRRFAASFLGRRTVPRAQPALLNALSDEDWQVRKLAAEALGLLRDERAGPGLLNALHDSNTWVRYAAACALGDLADPKAVDALLEVLDRDVAPVQLAAASALGKLVDPRAARALEAMSQHPDADFRRMAAEALGNIPGSTAALETLLDDPHPGVRRAAARSIGRLGDPSAQELLRALQTDPDPGVRQAAQEALAASGEA